MSWMLLRPRAKRGRTSRSRTGVILLLVTSCGSYCASGQADPDPLRFESEITQFEQWDSKNSFPPDAILFVGSSSIRLWPTVEAFANLPVVNRGFGGAHISDVNHFVEETTLKYRPRVIVFYAGDNDIWDNKTPQVVAKDFDRFLQRVREVREDTRFLFLSIKPSRSRWSAWDRMNDANSLIEATAVLDSHLTFVDIAPATFGEDGLPDSTLFLQDQLHLNAAGYARWESVVGPTLRSVWGDR